jgi:transcriptional regulator of arginine metabolism
MSDLKKTNLRHQALEEIIKSHKVADQESLVKLLAQEYNISTNQSIISRDIRQLGIVKRAVGHQFVYEFGHNPTREILRQAHVRVEHNESFIVIHTLGGLASFVGDFLDQQKIEGVLATLAGENVVFVAPVSIKNIKEIYKKISRILYLQESVSAQKDDHE